MFGGSAGGGKSDALLMSALQYVDIPGYAAILFRRTYTDLSLPGALMDRAHSWLRSTDARWCERDKTWLFPSGASITFGYLEHDNDVYRYQSSEFQFIGFDETTQFTENQYRYLFSRLRRLANVKIPLRVRAASNPGGIGHEWVRQRFIVEGQEKGRIFIPARIEDNPYIDALEYIASLNELDPVTRAQLLNGDWTAKTVGDMFRHEWLPIVDSYPAEAKLVRFWDLAATEATKGKDPDFVAGGLVGLHDGVYYIIDMRRARTTPLGVESLIKRTAEEDGIGVNIYIEQEGGASGKLIIDHYLRHVVVGFPVRGKSTQGKSKLERAQPFSAAAQAGNVKLVRGSWIGDFLNELEIFPNGAHDDQVDAISGAIQVLRKRELRDAGSFQG